MRKIVSTGTQRVLSDNPKSAIQNPKWWAMIAFAITFAFGGSRAQAQRTGKIFRIGYLDASTASSSAVFLEAFRQELSKLGWIEGSKYLLIFFDLCIRSILSFRT